MIEKRRNKSPLWQSVAKKKCGQDLKRTIIHCTSNYFFCILQKSTQGLPKQLGFKMQDATLLCEFWFRKRKGKFLRFDRKNWQILFPIFFVYSRVLIFQKVFHSISI